MSDGFYVFLFFALIVLVRGSIVVFHEMGHALTGIALYKGNFNVYIGSYGDATRGWHLKGGRLKIHFVPNPFDWERGLCVAEQQTHSFTRDFLFTLGGPLGSLVLSLVYLSLAFINQNEIMKVYLFLAFCYAFSDFVRNLIPNPRPIQLHDGGITYNDGYQLKSILKSRKNYNGLNLVIDLCNEKKYNEVITHYERLSKPIDHPMILRIAAYAYLAEKKYQYSLDTYAAVQQKDTFTADDHCNFALVHSHLDKHPEAIEYYNKALELDANHLYSLNNRGYSYNLTGDYEKGLEDFNKTIEINPEFAYAYNNRGLSKIKLGFVEEGLRDIEKSLELDVNNSYAYRNKGIYWLDRKNYEEAYPLFLKAKELDADTHLIDQYIAETQALMNREI